MNYTIEHRQGSVYCSNELMNDKKVYDLVSELRRECAWIVKCVTRMDVADIGNIHELTEWITSEAVEKIKQEQIISQLFRNAKYYGFVLSHKLIENYKALLESRGDIVSLEEISDEYRSHSTDKLINAIGDELKAQELQHISEMSDTPEI